MHFFRLYFLNSQDDELCTNVLVNRAAENVHITTFSSLSEVPFYSLLGKQQLQLKLTLVLKTIYQRISIYIILCFFQS